jgi:hypothetical protein
MMKGQCKFRGRAIVGGLAQIVLLVFLVVVFQMFSSPARAYADACSETSTYAKEACYNSANEEYNLALGKCENVAENNQDDCEANAKEDLNLAVDECNNQFDARQEVCKELGGGPYLPNGIKPFRFVSRLTGNTYFPLTPATYTYMSYAPNGKVTEKDIVKVTNQTRQILGVTCRVVRDIVTDPDGNVTEDTTDWYAQDVNRNVWYFGEIAQQFEGGILVGIEGSWTAGKDGAKPGYIMLVYPKKGDVYRQEFALGDAEDMGRVVETGLPTLPPGVKLLTGVHGPYLHTQDFSALEPDSVLEDQYEDKYYAPDVGLVLTIAPDGTQEILVSITKP